MSNVSPLLDPVLVARTLMTYRWRWLLPTLVVTVVAVGYAVVKPKTWEAAQALMLRDEAIGTLRAGRFVDADSMKKAQETVGEIVRADAVVTEALQQVGPPGGNWFTGSYPTHDDVEKLRAHISVRAPNGCEFGKTEVFYLRVSDTTPDRAIALTAALCDRLEAQLGALRLRKAESLMGENERTVQLAREDLNAFTARLSAIEKEVGSDLAELRVLNQPSGEGSLRTTLVAAKNDLRQLELVRQSKLELLESLKQAEKDTNQIVATPNELLESQPALKRLKDGLIDAQLQTSLLLAQMEHDHPKVQAAIEAQSEIRERLHGELASAVRGLQTEIDTNRVRIESLERQIAELNTRLGKLAQLRAEYSNLAIAVDRRNEILKKAEETLADSRASAAAAQTVNLITRIDAPATGNHPVGPGRTTIAAAGLFGGLLTGLGLVFLTAPFAPRGLAVRPGNADLPVSVAAEETLGAVRGPYPPCAPTFVAEVEEETAAEVPVATDNSATAAMENTLKSLLQPVVDQVNQLASRVAPAVAHENASEAGSNVFVKAFESAMNASPPAVVVETLDLDSSSGSASVEFVSSPILPAPAAAPPAAAVVVNEENDPWGQAPSNVPPVVRGGFSEADLQPAVKTNAAPLESLPGSERAKPGTLLGGALARLFAQTSLSR